MILGGIAAGGTQPTPGILVFSALRARIPGREDAKDPPAGLVYVAFRTAELFYSALARPPTLPANVEVFDGSPAENALLFRSAVPPDGRFSDDFEVIRKLDVAGREWTVRFRPTTGFQGRPRVPCRCFWGLRALCLPVP